jgi:hypothetical protein
MKKLIFLLVFISTQVFCESENDIFYYIFPVERNTHLRSPASAPARVQFKKRNDPNGLPRLVTIESNFTIPVVGRDKYFGYVVFNQKGNTIHYRDEVQAEAHAKQESQNPNEYYTQPFPMKDFNSSHGIMLLNTSGAVVQATSPGRNFNSKTGGIIAFRFKAPGSNYLNARVEVTVRNGIPSTRVLTNDGQRLPFTMLKINSGLLGILDIKNMEFYDGAHLIHTIDMP